MRQLIFRIENRTLLLRNSLNAPNQGNVNISGENVSGVVRDLKTAVTQLRARFDRRLATAADAQEVLSRAAQIDDLMRQGVRGTALRNWTSLSSDLSQLASAFRLSWPTMGRNYQNTNTAQYASNRQSGIYRLDPLRSDDPAQAADRATESVAFRDRARLRDQIAARLESPDQIAIELRGRDVTLPSPRASQITFAVDGVERVDATNGQTVRARATLNGDQLIVSSTGDAGNRFNVTFDPIANGRSLSVTRRVYVPGLTRPVIVQSIYQKTSDIAQLRSTPDPNPIKRRRFRAPTLLYLTVKD